MKKDLFDKFVKGVAATSIGVISQIIFGFVGLMVIVRYIPKDEFGVFVLIQAIATFFEVLSNLALEAVSIPWLITNTAEDDKPEAVNAINSYYLIVCIVFTVLIVLCKPLIQHFIDNGNLLIYVALFFFLNSYFNFFSRILQGLHQYRKIAISLVINGLGKFILVILFVVVFEMDLTGCIYAFLLSLLISIAYQYTIIPVKKRFILNVDIMKKLFRFGIPLAVNNIISFFATKIDRFMISAMNTTIGVAYFEVAAKIPENSQRMYTSFQTVFFPNVSELFARKEISEAEKVIDNSLRFISFVALFGTFIAFLFQDELITIMFSEKYIESAPALSILMVSLCVGLIGNIIGASLVAMGQSDKPLKINIVWAVTNAAGNFVMIPMYGFMGAAYATLLSICLTHPLSVWYLKKSGLKVRISQYLKPMIIFLSCVAFYRVVPGDGLLVRAVMIILFLVGSLALSVFTMSDLSRGLARLSRAR